MKMLENQQHDQYKLFYRRPVLFCIDPNVGLCKPPHLAVRDYRVVHASIQCDECDVGHTLLVTCCCIAYMHTHQLHLRCLLSCHPPAASVSTTLNACTTRSGGRAATSGCTQGCQLACQVALQHRCVMQSAAPPADPLKPPPTPGPARQAPPAGTPGGAARPRPQS
jgi:hypothetical protein